MSKEAKIKKNLEAKMALIDYFEKAILKEIEKGVFEATIRIPEGNDIAIRGWNNSRILEEVMGIYADAGYLIVGKTPEFIELSWEFDEEENDGIQ
jgi:hypothetical protein